MTDSVESKNDCKLINILFLSPACMIGVVALLYKMHCPEKISRRYAE